MINSPDDISNLVLCLDPDDISGGEGDYVSSWTDKKQGIIFSQATESYKPTLNLNAVNGHKQVAFNSDYLQTNQNIISGGTLRTLFIVCKYANQNDDGIFSDGAIQSSYNGFGYGDAYLNGSSRVAIYTHWTANEKFIQNLPNYSTTTASIATLLTPTTSLNTVIVRSNGEICTVVGNSGTINVSGNICSIGTAEGIFGRWSGGKIAYILYYNKLLSESEYTQVEYWLGQRFNITVPIPPSTFIPKIIMF